MNLRIWCAGRSVPPIPCGLCGREICRGESYWYVNGQAVCADCLGAFARQEFAPCRLVRGEEVRP